MIAIAMNRTLTVALAGFVGLTTPAWAQSIADRVAAVDDGRVRMSFTAREGVCGNGRNIMTHRDSDDWESVCDPGPVRVLLRIETRRIVDIDTYLGGRWRRASGTVTDLGRVPARAAAEFLLDVAEQHSGRPAKHAILPATLADSIEAWPRLLAIAKDQSRPRGVRKSAVFWVGQAASDAAVRGLEDLVEEESGELEVRESAVFALSQLKGDAGVPILIRVARTNPHPSLRKKAIFWLGQSGDPRAIEFFEEILLNP